MPDSPFKTTWTVGELLAADFPETRWIIPDIWPAGLTILGGRPKLGKSWFMLQLAAAVGSGGMMFGRTIEKGSVLYLALEDSPRRLKSRIQSMNIPGACAIDFQLSWPSMQGKGIDFLAKAIDERKYSLVVIDTMTRALPGVPQDKAEVIGPLVARMHDLAGLHDIGIGLVDHTRKPSIHAADPVDDIISSTAKTGAADSIFALYREQGKAGAVLKGRGRDMEEVDMRLLWDRETVAWQSQGTSAEFETTESENAILSALDELGKAQLTTIAKFIGKDTGNTSRRLNNLVNDGLIHFEMIEGKKIYERS